MPETMKTILEGLVALWNTGDLSIVSEIYSETALYHRPNRAEPIRGRSAIAFQVAETRGAFPDFKVKIDETMMEASRCAIRWTWTGTHQGMFRGIAPTNKTVTQHGMTLVRLESGRIVEEFMHSDGLALLRQLEMIPARHTEGVKAAGS